MYAIVPAYDIVNYLLEKLNKNKTKIESKEKSNSNHSIMSSYLTLPKDLVSNCFSYLSTTEKFFRPLYSSTTKSAPKKMDLSMIAAEYGRCTWIKVAALAGCTAVLMGAYGAHGILI